MADTPIPQRPNVNTRRRAEIADVPAPPSAEAPEMTYRTADGQPRIDPVPALRSTITLSTTVEHRGRLITITATDMTADQFCDLLDRRGFEAPSTSQQWQTLPDGTPICPRHHAPMRLREKQGDRWWSHNVGTKDAPCYCRGYKGKDSPGYDA